MNQDGTGFTVANKNFRKPTKTDLVYFENSPDYCVMDKSAGKTQSSSHCPKAAPPPVPTRWRFPTRPAWQGCFGTPAPPPNARPRSGSPRPSAGVRARWSTQPGPGPLRSWQQRAQHGEGVRQRSPVPPPWPRAARAATRAVPQQAQAPTSSPQPLPSPWRPCRDFTAAKALASEASVAGGRSPSHQGQEPWGRGWRKHSNKMEKEHPDALSFLLQAPWARPVACATRCPAGRTAAR